MSIRHNPADSFHGLIPLVPWIHVDDAMDAAAEPDLEQVRFGPRIYQLHAHGRDGWLALGGEAEPCMFALAPGGPLGYAVSYGSSARGRLIGVTWVTACARYGRSPLPGGSAPPAAQP